VGDFLNALAADGAEIRRVSDAEEAFKQVDASLCADKGASGSNLLQRDFHLFAFVTDNQAGTIRFDSPSARLAVATIQRAIDRYRANHPEVGIDFIHGSASLKALGCAKGNLGLYLPPVDKSSFFNVVIHDGVMPRKTFSMGEAPEKRFYIEARRIVP